MNEIIPLFCHCCEQHMDDLNEIYNFTDCVRCPRINRSDLQQNIPHMQTSLTVQMIWSIFKASSRGDKLQAIACGTECAVWIVSETIKKLPEYNSWLVVIDLN